MTREVFLETFASANPLDPTWLIATFGLVGVLTILFVETGLLIGFFLPGDSLLFLAGVAASPLGEKTVGASLSLPALLIGAPICAIVGAQLGHYLGARFGQKMFDRPNSRLFKRSYVEKAEAAFNRFGAEKAVMLGRFIPIVRTFINPVAGMLEMTTRRFFICNLIISIIWTDGLMLLGYKLVDAIPASYIDKYLLPVIGLIILISVSPMIVEFIRSRRHSRAETPAKEPVA